MMFFWNNRNARRKQSGSLLLWFSEFAEEVGPENVCLVMHTDPKDPNGQDLQTIVRDYDIDDGRIVISNSKVPVEILASIYNMADCTLNISDAEGFGLSTLESLSCGTPIIVNMTGGLQEQVTDGKNWFGVGIEPSSTVVIGSQAVPYINEDRISKEDFLSALRKIYNMKAEERAEMGEAGRKYVSENYNQEATTKQWDTLLTDLYNQRGTWENSKHRNWELLEVV
jgi:glycosyltransferase involved in cell wall biosynthesis